MNKQSNISAFKPNNKTSPLGYKSKSSDTFKLHNNIQHNKVVSIQEFDKRIVAIEEESSSNSEKRLQIKTSVKQFEGYHKEQINKTVSDILSAEGRGSHSSEDDSEHDMSVVNTMLKKHMKEQEDNSINNTDSEGGDKVPNDIVKYKEYEHQIEKNGFKAGKESTFSKRNSIQQKKRNSKILTLNKEYLSDKIMAIASDENSSNRTEEKEDTESSDSLREEENKINRRMQSLLNSNSYADDSDDHSNKKIRRESVKINNPVKTTTQKINNFINHKEKYPSPYYEFKNHDDNVIKEQDNSLSNSNNSDKQDREDDRFVSLESNGKSSDKRNSNRTSSNGTVIEHTVSFSVNNSLSDRKNSFSESKSYESNKSVKLGYNLNDSVEYEVQDLNASQNYDTTHLNKSRDEEIHYLTKELDTIRIDSLEIEEMMNNQEFNTPYESQSLAMSRLTESPGGYLSVGSSDREIDLLDWEDKEKIINPSKSELYDLSEVYQSVKVMNKTEPVVLVENKDNVNIMDGFNTFRKKSRAIEELHLKEESQLEEERIEEERIEEEREDDLGEFISYKKEVEENFSNLKSESGEDDKEIIVEDLSYIASDSDNDNQDGKDDNQDGNDSNQDGNDDNYDNKDNYNKDDNYDNQKEEDKAFPNLENDLVVESEYKVKVNDRTFDDFLNQQDSDDEISYIGVSSDDGIEDPSQTEDIEIDYNPNDSQIKFFFSHVKEEGENRNLAQK